MAAIYIAGIDPSNDLQWHIQLSALSDKRPARNAATAARYMPDVVATASMEQLLTSEDEAVFVCAVLGEMDYRNPESWMRRKRGSNPTTNVTLQALANEADLSVWDVMDEGTFQTLERVLSPDGPERVEYWHGAPNDGTWRHRRPGVEQIRVPRLVHEGSTLWIDEEEAAPVGLDYRPKSADGPIDNVYVTGGGLWPTSGSWNPTLTMVALAQDLADRLSRS